MKRNLKQKIASALIVSMMAGLTVSPAWGAEHELTWSFEDGKWYLYEDGDLVKDRAKRQGGKWYAFDAEGAMLSDQLYFFNENIEEEEEGEEILYNSYISPGGQMVEDKWVALTEDGQYYTYDSGDIYWYYFAGGGKAAPGIMKRNIVDGTAKSGQDKGQTFAWDKDGVMYAGEWLYVLEDEDGDLIPYTQEEISDSDQDLEGNAAFLRYFQQEGFMAKGKNLKFGDFWYFFNDDGIVTKVIPVASDSDAEEAIVTHNGAGSIATAANASEHRIPRDVVDIDLISANGKPVIDNIVEVVPGDPVILKYQITLASASNVNISQFRDKDHDIWLSLNKSGKTVIDDDRTNYQITVTYTPNLVKEETIQLFIDNPDPEKASKPVTIIPKLSSSKEQTTAVNNVMDSWQEEGYSASTVLNSIKEVLQSATNETQEANILNTLVKNDNYEALADSYAQEKSIEQAAPYVSDEAGQLLDTSKVAIVGSALSSDGNESVQLTVNTADESSFSGANNYAATIAFDLKLMATGENDDSRELTLRYPVKVTLPVPEGMQATGVTLWHILDEGGEEEVELTSNGDNTVTFIANSFSTYVFAGEKDNGTGGGSTGGGSSSGGGGGSSSSSSSTGTTITDPKKGQVNSVTGIITGSGDGYSNWVATTAEDGTVTWQLRYADGTMAAGSIVTREDGTTYEQVAWELINGAWYAFGADSNAKGGMIYDVDLAGYFYVDINSGMVTGWAQIDGQWRYFNPVSDGKRGIMFTDSWIDGWYVNPDGIWDGQAQAQ